MNKVWTYMMLLGTACLLFLKPDSFVDTLVGSAKSAVELCISLCAIYSVWLGIMEILFASGLAKKFAKKIRPFTKRLFRIENEKATEHISVNLSANMLGLGGVATPAGILAMQELDDKSGSANFAMIMLMVISATSIQILPTTVISLRSSLGSKGASDIFLPTLISTFVTTGLGVMLVFIWAKIKNHKKRTKR